MVKSAKELLPQYLELLPIRLACGVGKSRVDDFRFHNLRHTWASWDRQEGTSCDELKELGGWKSRQMVDRYAKHATEHLKMAASRIENGQGGNVGWCDPIPTLAPHQKDKRTSA